MANKRKQEEIEQERQDLIDKWKKQFETDRKQKATIDAADNANEEYYQGKRTFGVAVVERTAGQLEAVVVLQGGR